MLGTMSMGVRLPIIKENDDIIRIVADRIERASNENNIPIDDGDIIGITESIVARAAGLYVTVNDIAESVKKKFNNPEMVFVIYPIFSRNRFSLILKGIAKAVRYTNVILNEEHDEVGNMHVNQFTGVDIDKFYRDLIIDQGSVPSIFNVKKGVFEIISKYVLRNEKVNVIVSSIHNRDRVKQIFDEYNETVIKEKLGEKHVINVITLQELCDDINSDFGLLGSNKATEEKLKLFPTVKISKEVALGVQERIMKHTGKKVEVLIYGDGCFKDPVGGIWEFADPISAPYYTEGLEGTPNELKLKYIADNESADEDFIIERIKHKDDNLSGQMISQGTTPRMYRDLVASLCDLTSGSGDKGTPVIWIKNYFKNYAD